MKKASKIIVTMALFLVILFSIPQTAQAANVSFKTYTSSGSVTTYSFDPESTSFWVGGTYLQTGVYVFIAQSVADSCGYSPGICDGIYGTNTKNAIKLFQSAYALSSDGIVGTGTWRTMYTLRGSWMFLTN